MRQIVSVKALALVLSVLTVSPAVGAERVFSMPQAVKFSLENNGALKALRHEKGAREAAITRAGLHPDPVLELEGATGEITGSAGENRFSVGVSQEFVTMGKRDKRLVVADMEAQVFHHSLENSARLLSEEVKTLFLDLLLAQRRMALADTSVALAKRLLDITKQRVDAGDIPELELNLVRVEVARSEGRRLEAERDILPARARLLGLMGLSPGEEVGFSGSLEGGALQLRLEELKTLARTKRPDLKALEKEKGKGGAEIVLAQAERIPNVTAGIAYQRENSVVDFPGGEAKTRDNLVSLRISVPIPLFSRNDAGIREARARQESADTRLAHATSTAEREIEAALAALAMAEKSVAIYRDTIIPQLEDNLKLVQEAYQLGEIGILAVMEEQKKFQEINDSYLALLHGRQTSLVKLEAAVGTELGTDADGGNK